MMLRHTSTEEHVMPKDKAFFVWGTPLNETDRDPEFNILSPVGRRQSGKGLCRLRLPRPTLDSDRLYRARSNEDARHTIVYNKGPPGQTPFPTVVAMSGYFPPHQLPQQGFYPPPQPPQQQQHQNSYPPPSQPSPQAPPYYQASNFPGQAPSTQYSALGSTYAPANYPPSGYPPSAEPPKPMPLPEQPPAYPYPVAPGSGEKGDDKEREAYGGFTAASSPPPLAPVPQAMPMYSSAYGGMTTSATTMTTGSSSSSYYPYPTTSLRPVNSDEMFWILYHQRYNGNEKQTKESVAQEMARRQGQFGGQTPTGEGTGVAGGAPYYYPQPGSTSGSTPGSQSYPAPAQPPMYPDGSQQQQHLYQPTFYQQGQQGQEQQQPPKKDGPDWAKLAGGVAAGGLAFAGTKKLFDMVKGDKKAHHHHH